MGVLILVNQIFPCLKLLHRRRSQVYRFTFYENTILLVYHERFEKFVIFSIISMFIL